MASFFEGLAAKFSSSAKKEVEEFHGVTWEHDVNVSQCRECHINFSTLIRKHHCRGCGGIFCENCAPNNCTLPSIDEEVRACGGCRRGETPGPQITDIRKALANDEVERFGTHGFPISEQVNLMPDSLYNEMSTVSGDASHTSGYFEFVNKSEEIVCLKVLHYGGNVYHEVNRPCYLAIPPLETMHALFNPNVKGIELCILYDNPSRIPIEGGVYYNTRGPGVNARTMISPCAQVEKFNQLIVYFIPCQHKNVLLKYKGGGGLELKAGTKAKLASAFGFMRSASKNISALDMDTNATELVVVYPK
jgi:hypothetical protein